MRVRAMALVALAAGVLVGAGVVSAGAGTPTPDATLVSQTSTPAPTLEPGLGLLLVRVVEDRNGDGQPQEDEPGIGGVRITSGCSDGIALYETAADGSVSVGASDGGGCFRAERQFGWLPTTPASVRLGATFDQDKTLYFMMQILGDTVMEVSGEAIVAGVPAQAPSFAKAALPFGACVEPYHENTTIRTSVTIIVIGADLRAGCPRAGDAFSILMNGAANGPSTFIAGGRAFLYFVAEGDSMRLIATDADCD